MYISHIHVYGYGTAIDSTILLAITTINILLGLKITKSSYQ